MGAEREDTDPKRVGTEPGLGRLSSGKTPAATPQPIAEAPPPPVDFDALHAALGDPLDYDELPSGPAIETGPGHDELLDDIEAGAPTARGGDSSGRSSATYASARPHTIPPTRAPNEDLNAPAVIVAGEDTVPSAPPQMTVPLAAPAAQQQLGHAFGAPPPVAGAPVGPGAHPSSGAHAAQAQQGYVNTPPPFAALPVLPRGMHQMTMRMPDRPVNPRGKKTQTIVVRARGPSLKQKMIAFMALVVLVTAVGIIGVLLRWPELLKRAPSPSPSAAPSGLGSLPVAPSEASGVAGGAIAAPSGTSSAASAGPSPASGVKKVVKPAVVPATPVAPPHTSPSGSSRF